MIAVLHPPPTGYPMPLPQRGDCRMGGYGAPPERDLSPYCYNVYTSYVGLFMFARLCDGTRLGRGARCSLTRLTRASIHLCRYLFMRILRDVSELWKFRSLIKAAATRRFTYFPDIGWLMAFLWHIHQHPVREGMRLGPAWRLSLSLPAPHPAPHPLCRCAA